MILLYKKLILFLLSIFLFANIFSLTVYAQETTPTPTQQPDNSQTVTDLQNQINDLQNKIFSLQGQAKTLSSQISVMDNQMRLTQLRINATKQQIAALNEDIDTTTKKIDKLEESLLEFTKLLLNRIVVTYEVGTVEPLHVLLSSSDANDFFSRSNYLKIVQQHDKRLIYDTQQAKNDYANQKEIFEDKKVKVETLRKQLEGYTAQLDQEKKSKQVLLGVTQNDEARYQKLLKEAQAQIQAFKSFASSAGGASILPPQASPDGWYYNQRDERWGRKLMGASPEQIWEVGCLVTSVAMILKQRGENVTPADIAANSSYFFSNTAYMLIPWGGGRFTSVWSADIGAIDSKLSSSPVIVGVRAGPFGTHFIVLKSGSNGSYIMNDPWNGVNLKFTDYYSTGQIFQYGFYNG